MGIEAVPSLKPMLRAPAGLVYAGGDPMSITAAEPFLQARRMQAERRGEAGDAGADDSDPHAFAGRFCDEAWAVTHETTTAYPRSHGPHW
jgi:hypothetical protein